MYNIVYMIEGKPFGSKYVESHCCTIKMCEKLKKKIISGSVFFALQTLDIGCFPTHLPLEILLWQTNFIQHW